jgi:hypothetical protein
LIDFIKIHITDKTVTDRVTNLPFIHKENYSQWVNVDTGQVFVTHKYDLDGILFFWDDFKLIIVIKPHYYFNDNKHNANDFSPTDCITTLTRIIQRLQLEDALNTLKIVGLEYGVNFVIDYADTDVLNAIYHHSTNNFYNIKDLPYCKISYRPTPKGKANVHKQYKFYSKAIQHPKYCNPNTLRAEVRSNRSKFINKLDIYTLADLLNIDTYDTLRTSFLKETEQLLFIDIPTNTKQLTRKKRATVKKMSNPLYWQKALKKDRSKFADKKKQYFALLNKTGSNLTGSVIAGVTSKLNDLFNTKSGVTSSTPITEKSGVTSTYSIGRHYTTFKTCPVTKVDISMQKDDSTLLSNTGLKHLEKTDNRQFQRIKDIFLTGNLNKFEFDVYSMISKQIRNRFYSHRYQYHNSQTNLFAS